MDRDMEKIEEKLVKTLETLKLNLEHNTGSNAAGGGGSTKTTERPLLPLRILKQEASFRKDKIKDLIDIICSPEVYKHHSTHLRTTIDILLNYADADNLDGRDAAIEGIGRIVSILFESHSSDLLFAFFSKIRSESESIKISPSRSLRLAITKFSEICHLIRMTRLANYAASIFPVLTKIASRSSDDMLQETLFTATTRHIFSVLGKYAAEQEAAELLKAYLANLNSDSAVIRRCGALSIASLCESTRRPEQFYLYTLKSLLNLVNASAPEQTRGLHSAVFITFRALLPKVASLEYFADQANETSNLIVKDIYYIYQHLLAIVRYCSEPTVVVSALEALAEFASLGLFPRVVEFIDKINEIDERIEELSDKNVFELANDDKFRCVSIDDETLNDVADDLGGRAEINFFDNRSLDGGRTGTEYSASEVGGLGDLEDMSELTSELNFGENSDARDAKTDDDNSLDLMSQASSIRQSQLGYFDSVELASEATRPSTSAETVNVEHFNLGEMNSIDYAARLIALKFLLTGRAEDPLLSDEMVRISIKSIAISCLSALIKTCPRLLYLPLNHEPQWASTKPRSLGDVLGFAQHSDPNLRAQLALLVSNFLERVLSSPYPFRQWTKKNNVEREAFKIKDLLNVLKLMLTSGSSLLAKQILVALQLFVDKLLISNELDTQDILELLDDCFSLRNDSYWLVRTELINLVSRLPFKTLAFIEHKHREKAKYNSEVKSTLTQRLVHEVIFGLMFDDDHRVRQVVANNLKTIIQSVSLNVLLEPPVEATTFETILDRFSNPCHTKIFNEMFPTLSDVRHPLAYDRPNRSMFTANVRAGVVQDQLDSSLLYFVHRALHELVANGGRRKASMVGAINVLAKLVKIFPPEEHLAGWQVEGITDARLGSPTDVIGFLITLLTKNVNVLLDLPTQQALTSLIVELILASVVSQTKKLQSEPQRAGMLHSEADFLSQVGNGELSGYLEQMFRHLLKCLVSYASLVEHNSALFITFIHNLYTRTNLSKLLQSTSTTSSTKVATTRDAKTIRKELANKGSRRAEAYALDPLYSRLFDLLKNYWRNRKTSELKDAFLGNVLECLSRLLEVMPSSFVLHQLDDVLVYLNMVYYLDIVGTVRVVRNLLKCIFHVNYLALFVEVAKQHLIANPQALVAALNVGGSTKLEHEASLYNIVYTLPYLRFSHFCNTYKARSASVGSAATINSEGYYGTFLSWLRRLIEFKHVKIMSSDGANGGGGGGGRRLANEVRSKIRLFEVIVLKTMRHYPVSADQTFQCEAMDLFSQLLQFHINYAMLDSGNEFSRFALKQIEFAEASVPSGSPVFQQLIGHVFNFLVILCQENHADETIISLPGLIQFCDRLVAAGHGRLAIDGLTILVDHIFFFLNEPGEMDRLPELEAQREVVVAYCFKLLDLDDHRTFDLLGLIVNYYKGNNRTKLVNLSIRIGDILVTRLVNGTIPINSVEAFEALQNLIFSLAPTTFMGTIDLMRCLLEKNKANDLKQFNRSFPLTVIFLKLVILNLTEKTMLESSANTRADEAVKNAAPEEHPEQPEVKLVNFLLEKLATAVDEMCEVFSKEAADKSMLAYLLANYLLTLTYVFQSGMFPKLTKAATELLHHSQLNPRSLGRFDFEKCLRHFMLLGKFAPILTAHWLNLLYVISYDKLPGVLAEAIELDRSQSTVEISSINLEIVRRCALILLCDHLSESLESVEYLSWLVINHLSAVIELDRETPIHEFSAACHRKASSSGLFLQSIGGRHLDALGTSLGPIYAMKVLRCLERAHFSQSATLVKFLLEKFLFNEQLVAGYYNCIKYAEYIASNRLVAMFAGGHSKANNLLSLKDINNLVRILKRTSYVRLNHTVHLIKARYFNLRRLSVAPLRDPLTEVAASSPAEALPEIDRTWYQDIMKSYLAMPLKSNQFAQVRGCFAKLSVFDIENRMFDVTFELSNLRLVIEFVIDDGRSPAWSPAKTKGMPEVEKRVLAGRVMQSCQFYMHQLCAGQQQVDEIDAEDKVDRLAKAFLPVLSTLIDKSTRFRERIEVQLNANELIAKTVVDVYAGRVLSRAQREDDLVTLLDVLNMLEKYLDLEMFSLVESEEDKADKELEVRLVQLQCQLVENFFEVFSKYYELPLVEHCLAIEDKKMATSCVHLVAMLRAIELDSGSSQRRYIESGVSELVFTELAKITIHLARLPFARYLLYLPFDHYDVSSRNYSHQFWQSFTFGGRWRTKVPIVAPNSIEEVDIFRQFAYRIEHIGFATRVEFEEIWMTLLGVLSNTFGVLETMSVTKAAATSNQRIECEEANELIKLAGAAIEAITSLLYKAKWDSRRMRRKEKSRRLRSYSAGRRTLFGTKLETIKEQIRGHIECVDEQLDTWRASEDYYHEGEGHEAADITLAVLRDNSRRSSRGSENSAPSSPSKTVAIGESEESIDLYSCIHFLLDTYLQTMQTCLAGNSSPYFPLFSAMASSCAAISDLFVERAQYLKVAAIWSDLLVGVCETFEDELLNQHVIVGMAKTYSVVIGGGCSLKEMIGGADMFDKYRRSIIEHNLKSFFVPTKIASLKALGYLLECTSQVINWKEVAPVLEHLGKHLSAEGIGPLNYSRSCQRGLARLGLTLIENYRELVMGAEFIDRMTQSLVRHLTDNRHSGGGARDLRHVHALIERLLFSDKLSTKQIKTIKSNALLALRTSCGGGRVATLLRLDLFIITSYLLRAGDVTISAGSGSTTPGGGGQQPSTSDDEQLYKTMERLSNMFEPLRHCNSLEADLLSQTLATFLVDFFPPEHLLNKCIGEFLSNQQQHCKYLATMLFAIFSRFQGDLHLQYGTAATSQEWIVLSLSSFTQLVPITFALWALTCFLVCGAQNHWIRASYPYFQSRFGQFDENDKVTFFTICYHVFEEIKSDDNKKAFVKTFQKAASTASASTNNGSTSTTTTLSPSPYFEVLKYLCDP